MSLLTQTKFSFVSTALSSDTFAVVNFKGFEALSKPYDFDVMLVCEDGNINLSDVLQKPATFTIHRDAGDDVVYHGIVAQFEQHQEFNNCYFYRARLVPKLWWLSLTFHNQIFLDKTIQEIIELVLKDAGLTSLDYNFKVQGSYSKIDYVCQYGESHLNFISRWIEREGLYYYFEQTSKGEKVIFTDSKLAHGSPPQGDKLFYAPPSGLDSLHRLEVIKFFTCRQKLLPQKIFLKDYNYEKPSLEVTGNAPVDPQGRGEVYYYGEHFKTPQDGNRLAKIRAEEMLCRKEEYIGESTVPYIQPGYTFELQDHYRQSINQQYLTISNTFEGSQTGYLISGLKQALADLEEQVYFLNHFTAIPAAVQFRTERLTQKVKIQGTVQAKVDAGGSGQYAEIDDHGRYKVKMPFDQSGLKDGKASIWLRMVQPYAGAGMGMHFPLHKGTEVMIAFNEGDPDRPIIAGAVPNPETASPVTGGNQSQCVIQTGGKNRMAIEDQAGSERILLDSPTQKTFIRIGAPNDPCYEVDGRDAGAGDPKDASVSAGVPFKGGEDGGGGAGGAYAGGQAVTSASDTAKAGKAATPASDTAKAGDCIQGCNIVTNGMGFIQAKEGIFLNATPSVFRSSANYLHGVQTAIEVTQAIAAATSGLWAAGGLKKHVGASIGLDAISLGLGFASPGIVLTSPSAIINAATSSFGVAAGVGINFLTVGNVELTGLVGVSLTTIWEIQNFALMGNIDSYALKGDINMKAGKGNIKTEAMMGDIDLNAGVSKTGTKIQIKNKGSIILNCRENNSIEITSKNIKADENSIKLNAKGNIEITGGGMIKVERGKNTIAIEEKRDLIRMNSQGNIALTAHGDLNIYTPKGALNIKSKNSATINGKQIKIG